MSFTAASITISLISIHILISNILADTRFDVSRLNLFALIRFNWFRLLLLLIYIRTVINLDVIEQRPPFVVYISFSHMRLAAAIATMPSWVHYAMTAIEYAHASYETLYTGLDAWGSRHFSFILPLYYLLAYASTFRRHFIFPQRFPHTSFSNTSIFRRVLKYRHLYIDHQYATAFDASSRAS